MTPAELEWAQEQIELEYLRGNIGKIVYIRRMSALGPDDIKMYREKLKELDKYRHRLIGGVQYKDSAK